MVIDFKGSGATRASVILGNECIEPSTILHPQELARLRDMKPSRANDFIQGRYALKRLLVPNRFFELNVLARVDGQPYVQGRDELYCSISHTDQGAMAAVSSRPVGVDIEQVRPRNSALLRYIASSEECLVMSQIVDPQVLLLALWVVKESAAKADSAIFALNEYAIYTEGCRLYVSRGKHVWEVSVGVYNTHVFAFATIL